ncbi:Aste57867_17177 [Aphanomyces stellatus]|uniref:Aste57867_17177 protein n=1 Tax=Aphanomyces stellatus TaxID=120398 RepID=A0A485L762_9STRA|nr:hypothetical protein As57867_017118 [Aphanomyces stellatus]VFT93934.1 Aste57867_17177 [Aphanomyces stellatus]
MLSMQLVNCFYLPQAPPRVVFTLSTAEDPHKTLSLPLDQEEPTEHAGVTSICAIIYDGVGLELQGRTDGSLHLLNNQDGRSLLSYDVSKSDPITQVSLHVVDSCLEIIVLLQSGKILAVEGLHVSDVLQSPPIPMPVLFTKARLRVGNVGQHQTPYSSKMLIRRTSSSADVFVANHGNSSVSMWIPTTRQNSNGKSMNTFQEHSCITQHMVHAVQDFHLSHDGQILIVVTEQAISWWDTSALVLLYEHSVAPRQIQSSACFGNGLGIAYASSGNQSPSSIVTLLDIDFKGPQETLISETNCGTFTVTSATLYTENCNLIVCGIALNEMKVFRVNDAPTNQLESATKLQGDISNLDEIFRAMQNPVCSISREEFQSALWQALDTNPEMLSSCLSQDFPRCCLIDWLLEDLNEWKPEDEYIRAQHARWVTFQLMSNSATFSATLWHEFRSANFVHVMEVLISQGAMGRLQILWRRHASMELVAFFSLSSLPLEIPAAAVTAWLSQEVIPSFQYYKVSMETLSISIVKRATLVANEGDIEAALQWTSVICPQILPPERLWKQTFSEKDPVRLVHVQLQQLVYLGKEHDFHVSYETFQMATVGRLAMAMLDRVQLPSLLSSELNRHVEPFLAKSSSMSLDDVLVEYVQEKASEIPFDEHRCIALLKKITALEKRAKSTLVVLQSIHLPYSPAMLDLAVEGSIMQSSCQMELQEQLRLMQLEELFRQYGLKYDLRDIRLPARFCRYLCTQVDNPNAFIDALNLAQASHQLQKERVIVQYMQNVLLAPANGQRIDQLLSALESIDPPRKWSAAVEVVQFGLQFLNTQAHLSQLLLLFITPFMQLASGHRGFERVVNATLQHSLRQLHQLGIVFNLPISMTTYQSKSEHPKILTSLLQPWLQAIRQPTHSLKRKRTTTSTSTPRQMTTDGTNALVRAQQCSLVLGMSTGEFRAFLGVQAATEGDVDQALRFSRNTNASSMKQVAVALLRYMVASKHMNQRGLYLARDLLVQCVIHESCSNIHDDVALLKQVHLLCSIYDHTKDQAEARDELYQTYQPWRVYDLWYRGAALTLQASVLPLTISYVMALHQNVDGERIMMTCRQLISHLVDIQAPQLALAVLLNMPSVPDDALEVMRMQLDQMLSLILYSHQIDRDLALGYMLSMEQQTAFSALNKRLTRENVYNDFARLQQLARLGSEAARTWQQIGFLHICTELETNAKWWHHLNLLGITCDHKAFRSDRRDHKALQAIVPQLLEATNLDLYCVLEFTRQYNIPDSVPCLLFVKALLLSSNDYASQIVGVLDDIHEHELIPLLLSIFQKLSSTDYERLLFVLNLLQNSSYAEQDEVQNRIQVLHFLQHYTPPLPFHAIIADPWSVLESELSASTVGQLVSLCSPLDIDADEMYMRLIKCMIEGDTASLSFESFRGLLSNFSETDHKITTAEWLSKKIDHSSFSIAAVQFALDLSLAIDTHPKTPRLRQTLLHLQSEDIWNNMSQQYDGAVLPDIQDPKKLIETIYHKYGHLAWQTQSSLVHETASQVAKLHKINIISAQQEIRWKWLTIRHKKPQQSVWDMSDDFNEGNLLDRLIYISWTGDKENIQELVKYASDPLPRAGLTYRVKYRALQVAEKLAEVMQISINNFLPSSISATMTELKQSCRHLVLFEELQYPHSLMTFLKCDKEGLVRGLWREHFQDPIVLTLISELMLSYSIPNSSLWQRVLQQMISLEMFPTLFHILRPLIRQFPSVDLRNIFEQIVLWPLHHLNSDVPKSKLERILKEIVLLIQQCPFIENLNVVGIARSLHAQSQEYPDMPILAYYAVQTAFCIPRVESRQGFLCQLCDEDKTYTIHIFEHLVNLSPLQPLEADFLVQYVVLNPTAQEKLLQSALGKAYSDFVARLVDSQAMDFVLAYLYVSSIFPILNCISFIYPSLHHHRLDDASDTAAVHLHHYPEKKNNELTPLHCYLMQTTSSILRPYQAEIASLQDGQ